MTVSKFFGIATLTAIAVLGIAVNPVDAQSDQSFEQQDYIDYFSPLFHIFEIIFDELDYLDDRISDLEDPEQQSQISFKYYSSGEYVEIAPGEGRFVRSLCLGDEQIISVEYEILGEKTVSVPKIEKIWHKNPDKPDGGQVYIINLEDQPIKARTNITCI